MQETIKEKDIISWLAGFYDAEGCFRISKCVRKHGYTTYRPVIILNNTDINTIDYCILLLGKFGINCYVRESRPTTNRKKVKYIEVSRISKVIALCDLLLPYSIVKYEEIRLLRDFCVSRHTRFMKHNIKNKKLPYSVYEKSLSDKIVKYKAHKKGRKCLSFEPIYSNLPNDVTWSWFAGYTDGDGSFSINKRGSASYCVATTNPNASEKINKFLLSKDIDFYFYSQLPAKNHLKTCKLRVFKYFVNNTPGIIKLIKKFNKYLITKHHISELMFEYCMLRYKNKGKWRTDYEKSFVNRMKLLTL